MCIRDRYGSDLRRRLRRGHRQEKGVLIKLKKVKQDVYKRQVYILTKGVDAAERDANIEKYSAWVKTLTE